MKKLYLESTIEIWSASYITHPELREKDNKDKIVAQCENSNREGYFIVEVVDRNVIYNGNFCSISK